MLGRAWYLTGRIYTPTLSLLRVEEQKSKCGSMKGHRINESSSLMRFLVLRKEMWYVVISYVFHFQVLIFHV